VQSIEQKLRGQLDAQGLGFPFNASHSVAKTVEDVIKYQGAFVEGLLEESLGRILAVLLEIAGELLSRQPSRRPSGLAV
jgi:hypothetical protein